MRHCCGLCGIAVAMLSVIHLTPAGAAVVPFTEEFVSDSSNWYDSPGTSPLGWSAAGGPDASSYAWGTFNFVSSSDGDPVALLRAQDEFGSSGGAFEGDWITDGVTQITAQVRHDAGLPLPFFFRFASPVNFPGAAGVVAVPVPSGVWTEISVQTNPGNPFIVYEGPASTYGSVFANVGHVQIGVQVPAALAGVDGVVTFDLDKPTILPEPASLSLMLIAAALTLRPRRWR